MCGWRAELTSYGCSRERSSGGGPGIRRRCAVLLHAAEHTPMRKAICLTGDDTQGGIGKVRTIATRRSSVGIPHLFYPVQEGSNPGGDRDPPNVPKTPLCERKGEWGAMGGGPKRRRERERERAGEREGQRGGERPTEQESGANRHCARVVGSS